MRKPPVLPVPFLARAIMLFLAMINGMDSYWIGVGTLYPFYVNASMIFSFSLSSIKFLYFVALMSFMKKAVPLSARGDRILFICWFSRNRCPSSFKIEI